MKDYEVRSPLNVKCLLHFIDRLWPRPNECNPRSLYQLSSLMLKSGAKSLIAERVDTAECTEVATDMEPLSAYFGGTVNAELFKMTFVDKELEPNNPEIELADDNFLASVFFVNYKAKNGDKDINISHIPSAVVGTPSRVNGRYKPLDAGLSPSVCTREPLLNSYYHIINNFQCEVSLSKTSKRTYNLSGTCFCQQNGLTSACAHAALRMAINSASGLHIDTRSINEFLKITPRLREPGFEAGNPGLDSKQVCDYLESQGLLWETVNFFDEPNADYAEYIHRFIEGRSPVLLAFTTHHGELHVVPVFGHTINSDMWRPEAEFAYFHSRRRTVLDQQDRTYLPAACWTDHFIIHDDNFGPYSCMPVDSLKRITLPKHDRSFRAFHAIAINICPRKEPVPSSLAEMAADLILEVLIDADKLPVDSFWVKRIKRILGSKNNAYVVRTMLIEKKLYRKHLLTPSDKRFDGYPSSDVAAILNGLPMWFYLVEVTIPDLYRTDRTKILDILLPCSGPKTKAMEVGWLFGNLLMVRHTRGMIKIDPRTHKICHEPLSFKGRYPMARVQPQVYQIEW